CLTLDPPVAGAVRVPSLVGPDGCLWPLGQFLARLAAGRINPRDVETELAAQHACFHDLVGHPPTLVNSHQHVSLFPPAARRLRARLARTSRLPRQPRPYLRRGREPWGMLARIPGARLKRALLSLLGRAEADRQVRASFPGADWLAGITGPRAVRDPAFFRRWL